MGRGDGKLPPWRRGLPAATALPPDFLHREVVLVARDLLGKQLVSTVDGRRTCGVIVEVEAYRGLEDPASHAATRTGRTKRNEVMFGPAGRAYVYRSYGVHWCVNVVTGREGDPQAVLIRGLEPLEGEDVMRSRRHGRKPLAAGPGRLCEALGVTGALNGHALSGPPLTLTAGWSLTDSEVGISGRVGVRLAADRPYRFYVRNSDGVSKPDGWRRSGAAQAGGEARTGRGD